MITNINSFLSNASKYKITQKVIAASLAMLIASQSFAGMAPDQYVQVNLDERPTIQVYGESDTLSRKVIEVGEYSKEGTVEMFEEYVKFEAADGSMLLAGEARVALQGGLDENHEVCLVQHKQSAHLDGDYYQFDSETDPIVYNKHYVDFYIKSHETIHCSFLPDAPTDGKLEGYVYTSLREVAADLGAIIDHMRVTGNNDMYTDFLKPMRLSSVGDYEHRTTWALAEVLKDVDPAQMMHNEAKDVPEIVSILMNKHFMDETGLLMDMDKPASRLIESEVKADIAMKTAVMNNSSAPEVAKLKADMSNTIANHIEGFKDSVDEDSYLFYKDNFEHMIEKHGLPAPQMESQYQVKAPEKAYNNDSFAEYYLGR